MRWFFIAATMATLTFIGLHFWAYSVYVGSSQITWGADLPSVSWISEDVNASSISFAKSSWLVAYEFTVSEDDFRKWLKRKALGEPEALLTPLNICRWYAIKPNKSEAEIENRSIEIKEGLVLCKKNEGGGGVLIIYDNRNRRAYYEWSRQ